MPITQKMLDIYTLHENGVSHNDIAIRYGLTTGTIEKKIKKYQKEILRREFNKQNPETVKYRSYNTPQTWSDEAIKLAVERYIAEHGSMPTSQDFDECVYLPSARQIQRRFGGLVALRKLLGYGDMDYTKGELRKRISTDLNATGIIAEDFFEPILYERFGEPYVHVQKRYYKGTKNRYDFFVYARNLCFGVDIFTTNSKRGINKNIWHKVERYKKAPNDLNIYFVLVGDYDSEDIKRACDGMEQLKYHKNMIPIHELDFIKLIAEIEPLQMPDNFRSVGEYESIINNDLFQII